MRLAWWTIAWVCLGFGLSAPALAQDGDADARRELAADALFAPLKGSRPGCAAGVFRAGTVVYSRAFGMANVELAVPLGGDSVLALDSMSKQFTGMSVVLLALRGKLSVNDDVRKFLPELPDYGATVRISHLLHHTSGLKDGSELLVLAGYRPPFDVQTKETFLRLILRQRTLNFAPGSEFLYSDTNYFLLGLIVERVSGRPLEAFAHDEIFAPLGMTHTEFRQDSSRIIPNRATQYNKSYDPSPSDGMFHNADSHVEALGADGVFSTIADLAKWDGNFYKPVVGGPKAIELMLETAKLSDGSPNDYATGLYVGAFHGLRKVEHSGGGAGSDSEMIRFPDQQLTIAVLCNVRDEDQADHALTAVPLARKMLDIYLEAPAASPTGAAGSPPSETPPTGSVSADAPPLQRFAGLYWNGRFDRVYRLSVTDDRLTASALPNGPSMKLERAGDDRFRAGPLTMAFNTDASEIAVSQSSAPRRTLVRVGEPAADASALKELAGDYYSSDVDAVWRLRAREDRLIVQVSNFPDEVVRPAFRDAFFTDRGLLRFTRDAHGAVSGFEVGNARVWKVAFVPVRASAPRP